MSRSSTPSSSDTEHRAAHGFHNPPALRVMIVAVVGAFLWSPMVHGLFAGFPALRMTESAEFWDGSRLRVVEGELAKASFLHPPMLRTWALARLLLIREGTEPMIIGSDGYIFDGRYLENPPPAVCRERLLATADGIAVLDRKLRALGIPLLLLPVPVKGWVLPQHLPRGAFSTPAHYKSFLLELTKRGVDHIDLLTPLEAEARNVTVFFRSDTHWSCLGAEIAARLLSERLRAVLGEEVRAFDLRTTGTIRDGGNAFDKLGIPSTSLQSEDHAPAKLLRRFGHLRDEPIRQVVDEEGLVLPSAKLRGDPQSPVVLLGTSFSLASGFLDYLAHFTGNRVRSLATPGAGAMGNFRSLFDQDLHRLPAQLVWEWPAHEVYTHYKPLPGLGATLARLPQVSMTPLPIQGQPFALPPHPILVSGKTRVALLPVVPRVSLCGALSLRLRGQLVAGPVQLTGEGLIATTWTTGESVDVPVGQLDGIGSLVMSIESSREACTLLLRSVEWVTDAEIVAESTSGGLITIRKGDALLVPRESIPLLTSWPELKGVLQDEVRDLHRSAAPFALTDLSHLADGTLRLPQAASLEGGAVLLRQRILK